MASLVKLDPRQHAALKVSTNRAAIYAQSQHLMPLRVTDASQAVSNFPVFLTRETETGEFTLSALTSFTAGQNLFVEDGRWCSTFQSSHMQTYPLFLMQPDAGETRPPLGIHSESSALGADGDALFSSSGKPSLWTEKIRAHLLDDANNTVHTYEFTRMLQSLDLIRQIDLVLTNEAGSADRIRGLYVIHEDNLNALAADDLIALRDKGYLGPIYVMLSSIFQVNAIIRRHNHMMPDNIITKVNLEVTKA